MCDWSKPGESQADDYKTIGHMIFARAHHHIKSFKKSTGSQLGCDSIEPFFTSSSLAFYLLQLFLNRSGVVLLIFHLCILPANTWVCLLISLYLS
jgi:hypothetical protein